MSLGRIMRGAELEHQLMLFAEVDLLQMPALCEIPKMQTPAIFAGEQHFGDETVLERVRRAPFAGDHGVVAELLRSAVDLPPAERLEALLIHDKDSARRLAILVAERRDIDAAGPAMDRMRARVAGLVGNLLRLNHLHDLGRARVGLGV